MTDVEACEIRKVHKEIILVLYIVMQVFIFLSTHSSSISFIHLFNNALSSSGRMYNTSSNSVLSLAVIIISGRK